MQDTKIMVIRKNSATKNIFHIKHQPCTNVMADGVWRTLLYAEYYKHLVV